MSADFLDSNVLLYLASADERRAAIVKQLLKDAPTVSAQVLNEVTNVLRRKHDLAWPIVSNFVEDVISAVVVLPLRIDTNRSAHRLAERYGFEWYDALIVASALEAGCTRLITEDMHHGQRIGDLTITNPFRA